MTSFASDNNAGIHPRVLAALNAANEGRVPAYGNDAYTQAAIAAFKRELGEHVDVYFVVNGTAANVLSIDSVARSHHAVLTSQIAHLNVDECGAPERFTGCKLIDVPRANAKLRPEDVERAYRHIGDPHRVQLRVVSLTQSTELGTVYTLEEIKAITRVAHGLELIVHMDGARLANAAAHLGCSLRETTGDVGVDVLSFGGTKNGLMIGEAVVFFDPALAAHFEYRRKQAMQLPSKMRFIAAQFSALLTDGLWLENARHANNMATLLAKLVADVPQVKVTQAVEANAVFAILPPAIIPKLQAEHYFYMWDEDAHEVRWMMGFDTTEKDVRAFAESIKRACAA